MHSSSIAEKSARDDVCSPSHHAHPLVPDASKRDAEQSRAPSCVKVDQNKMLSGCYCRAAAEIISTSAS
jgi:hypothetical protein